MDDKKQTESEADPQQSEDQQGVSSNVVENVATEPTADAPTSDVNVEADPVSVVNVAADVDRELPRSNLPRVLAIVGVVVVLGGVAAFIGLRRGVEPEKEFKLGLDALQKRRYSDVDEHVRTLGRYPEYKYHVHYLFGIRRLLMGAPDQALPDLREAAENEDLRPMALAAAGEALLKMNDYQTARQILQEALRLQPGSIGAHRNLGILYYDLGAMEQAVTHLRVVADLAPTDPRPHRLMGLIHKDYNRYMLAWRDYLETLKRNPYQPEREAILIELAEVQIKLRQFAQALETLRQCSASAESFALQGNCYRNAGDEDAAIKVLQQGLKKEPTHLKTLLTLGTIELERANPKKAIEYLKVAIKHHAMSDTPRLRLAEAYRASGMPKEAESQFAVYEPLRDKRLRFAALNLKALEEPFNKEVLFEVAELARELNKKDLALMWYQAVLRVDREHAQALKALAAMVGQAQAPPGGTPYGPQRANPGGSPKPVGVSNGKIDPAPRKDAKQINKSKPSTVNSPTKTGEKK